MKLNKSALLTLLLLALAAAISVAAGSEGGDTRLVFSSDSMVYIVAPGEADASFNDVVLWSLNAKKWPADTLGVNPKRLTHIDECKPIDGGRQLMLTSSYDWAAIVDVESKLPRFFANDCRNAHSIELIPGGMVAVACSDKGDQVRLYTDSYPARLLDIADMPLAHGVVWIGERNRLYAIGNDCLVVFEIADGSKLHRIQTIRLPTEHAHDLSAIDSDNLLVSGIKSFLYNLDSQTWSSLPIFVNSTSIKSVNYNRQTRELWYTDATDTEAEVKWRCDRICHASSPEASAPDQTIYLDGRTAYKVRVIHW